MSLRTVALIALAVFLVLYGLMTVSNIRVDYMPTICGFSALVAGILIFVWGLRQSP